MKIFFQQVYRNRYFLLFVLLFAYVESIYARISIRNEINAYIFTPEAALASCVSACILFVIMLFFIRKWQKADVFSVGDMFRIFISSLLVYMLNSLAIGWCIAFLFDNIERNFNPDTLLRATLADFLNGFIYGSFFLAYTYYKANRKYQQQMAAYQKTMAESRISQLKTQLNPHFLFNNLNVLDQFIEEDKHKASDFLNEFSDIYRYVLQASDNEIISLSEELDFARQYFRLIQHRYGEAYQLKVEAKSTDGFIVPLTLQLLIENAVQHNLGTADNPIIITITVDEQICVRNNINLKRKTKPASGRALSNLKEQYRLLTGKLLNIEQKNFLFTVNIPLVHRPVK